jgi:hypothetical protein
MEKQIVIKEKYVNIFDDDHCAAVLCNFYEIQHNAIVIKVTNDISFASYQKRQYTYTEEVFYQYHGKDKLRYEIMNLFGINKIGDARAKLVAFGVLIEKENLSKNGNYDNSKCYIFNHIKLAELLGEPMPKTNEEMIGLVKIKQPKTLKNSLNDDKLQKNGGNLDKTQNPPLFKNKQYKDIYISNINTNNNNNNGESIKNKRVKPTKNKLMPVQQLEMSENTNQSRRPYSCYPLSERLDIMKKWYAVEQNKEHISRAISVRKFRTYEVSEQQINKVLVSFADKGLSDYYKNIDNEGEILRRFPIWAAGSKDLYPIQTVDSIQKFINSSKIETLTNLETFYGSKENLTTAIIKVQGHMQKFVERAHDSQKQYNNQLTWSSDDFPVPNLANIRFVLYECAKFKDLEYFCMRLDNYNPAMEEMQNKREFKSILDNILKQIKK